MRYPVVLQHDATDCGPAVLAMAAAFHGKSCSLAILREAAGTDRQGTNLAGLVAAADKIGFTARAVRATPEALDQVALPAVAHWKEDNRNHFVLVYRLTAKHATIGDPASGIRRLPIAQFREYWTGVLVLLSPSARLRECVSRPSSFSRLVRLLLPHRRVFLDALLAAMVMTILGLASSFFIQALVDYVFVLGRAPALNLLTLGMLIVLVARTAFQGLRTYLLAHLSLRVDSETVLGFHRHLLGLPLPFFMKRKTGEILSRINDAVKIRIAITAATLSAIVDGLLVVVTAGVMVWLNRPLAFAALALTPILGVVVWLTSRPMKRHQRIAMERAAEVEACLVESLGAIQTVKAARAESLIQTRTEGRFSEMLEVSYRSQLLALGSSLASTLVSGASMLALLWVGGRQVLEGTLTVGQLMAFHSLLGMTLGPVERLANTNQPILDAVVAADRLGEILELDTEISVQRPNAVDRPIDGAIEFDNVACRYGHNRPVFEGVTFSVAPGECVGIAGHSGCGKTTLASLLGRFLNPSSGRIAIDGIDIVDYTIDCLRREIAYVPQDIVLLNGSIADNIRLGKPTATPSEIRMAGRLARVDEFADRLPVGYDTIVGERGLSLSGGERQRVAIARAILTNPAILVLDEPTSHLDRESELAVQRIVDERRGRRTTLVISHRPMRTDRTVNLSGEERDDTYPAIAVAR